MLAADTNILVRLLVSDDLAQQQAVAARLAELHDAGEWVTVSSLVLAETSWVLSSAYRYDRPAIAKAVRGILLTPPFLVPDQEAALQALDWFTQGPADFADYLILALAVVGGASTLLTFDKKLLRHPLCQSPAGTP